MTREFLSAGERYQSRFLITGNLFYIIRALKSSFLSERAPHERHESLKLMRASVETGPVVGIKVESDDIMDAVQILQVQSD